MKDMPFDKLMHYITFRSHPRRKSSSPDGLERSLPWAWTPVVEKQNSSF